MIKKIKMSTVFFAVAIITSACASFSGDDDESKSLGSILRGVASSEQNVVERAIQMLGYDGVMVPGDQGPSAKLFDVDVYDIGGFLGKSVWMSLGESRCFPVSTARELLGGDFERLNERSEQYQNDAYTVLISSKLSAEQCVGRVEIWSREK